MPSAQFDFHGLKKNLNHYFNNWMKKHYCCICLYLRAYACDYIVTDWVPHISISLSGDPIWYLYYRSSLCIVLQKSFFIKKSCCTFTVQKRIVHHSIIDKLTKTLIMSFIRDDAHFLHVFLKQLPSGRYKTLKICSTWGKDCFFRSMIHDTQTQRYFKYDVLLLSRSIYVRHCKKTVSNGLSKLMFY